MRSIIRKRLERLRSRSGPVDAQDIQAARRILFCVLSRYGDGIISFKIIKEFKNRYPAKEYVVLTSRQQLPYAREILGEDDNLEISKVNKRNPLSFFATVRFLKRKRIDIGFNPWGHGDDGEFFISYAEHFHCYKTFDNFHKTYNLYDRVREYLNLEVNPAKKLQRFDFSNIDSILIAPLSTDKTKNLTVAQINNLIDRLRSAFPHAAITTAIPKSHDKLEIRGEKFIFRKSNANSLRFLATLKGADLCIGVDSGPLHLAMALGIRSIAIFGPTSPGTILDDGQKVGFLRNPLLKDTFCFVENCPRPVCIDSDLFIDLLTPNNVLNADIRLETDRCTVVPMD